MYKYPDHFENTLLMSPLYCIVIFLLAVCLDQGSANCGPWVKAGLLSAFINKVLLEHSHTHSFTYCLWPLSLCNGRIEQLEQRQHGSQSHLLSDPLEAKVAELVLDHKNIEDKLISFLSPHTPHFCHTWCLKTIFALMN